MKIKEMRQNFGYTQKQFSEITGIPKRTVEDWEAKAQSSRMASENDRCY